jgi:enoyl-CoA hydratase/carnithine racemase
MDAETLEGLYRVHQEAAAAGVRAIVFGGRGDSFSAGGDLKTVVRMQSDDKLRAEQMARFPRLFNTVAASPMITIAAVDGPAFGGGLELVLACDLAIASARAVFGDGHINVALLPGGGSTQRLPRLIGLRRSLWLGLSGGRIDAATALDWGLVNMVSPAERFWADAWGFADDMAAKPREVAIRIKRLMRLWQDNNIDSQLKAEIVDAEAQLISDEAKVGIESFLNRPRRG